MLKSLKPFAFAALCCLIPLPADAFTVTGGNFVEATGGPPALTFVEKIEDINIGGTTYDLKWVHDSFISVTDNGNDVSMFPWFKTDDITWGQAYGQAQSVVNAVIEILNEADVDRLTIAPDFVPRRDHDEFFVPVGMDLSPPVSSQLSLVPRNTAFTINVFQDYPSNDFDSFIPRNRGVSTGIRADFVNFQAPLFLVATPTEAIPTPALLPGLLGMGAAALRKRKRETESEV